MSERSERIRKVSAARSAGRAQRGRAMSKPVRDPRVTALRRFAISITIFNIIGYIYLGFEQPWTWPLIAIATGYLTELGLEMVAARAERRRPRFLGNGMRGLVEYLYPAHITSLAVNMLLYVNDQLLVMIFGVMVGISGKWVLQTPVRGRLRHYMNPSNLGIAVVLLLFPWASIAPPYHFTENLFGWTDWIIPVIIIGAGTMLNGMLTKRMWLIWSWVIVFALQAVIRGVLFDTAIPSALLVMTGVAFVLFSNYMIPDPGTTPTGRWSQIAFGGGTAALYGLYTGLHVAYGLFFALATVCLVRGLFLWSLEVSQRVRQREAAAAPPAEPALQPVAVEPEVLRA
jgi:enediyne biosynthesis protein E5